MRLFFPTEYKAILRLGIPITIGQIGLTLQNIADNIMVGQHSTEELAAAGLVNNLFVLAILLAVGFSIGAVSQIGALYSQNKKARIMDILKSSIIADALQGIIILFVLGGLYFALPYMNQPEELVPLMKPYLLVQILSFPFMFLTNPFKQTTDSINDTSVAMIIMLIGNIWNVIFNYFLIFGKCGFPEMGIIGAGWATASSRILMFILFLSIFFFRPKYKDYIKHWKTAKVSLKDVLLLNRLGWPIAIQLGMEVAAFSLVAIFIGWVGTTHLAAHQVMISISNIVFMSFMGFSNAISIRVSNYNGLKDMRGVRHATFAGYEIVVVISAVLSVFAYFFRHDLSMLFTENEEVAGIVSTCVYALILYQLGDGMQCAFSNALRGLGDVKKLMLYSFYAYIVISIPLSYLFGIVMEGGTFGVWMGFHFGLTTAGVLYLRRFFNTTKHSASFV
ncbi:MAG: MATE family efflux transporter [Bacteroidales bacterium]|nr:MATE family efflux transporter [Bacteroidales bacterium]